MSALGEYYRAMGAAAMEQSRAAQGHVDVGHENALAAQTGANAAMRNAESAAVLHSAQAFLTNEQGKVVVPMSNAQIGLTQAQTGHYGALSRNMDTQTQQIPYDSQSKRDLEGSQRDYYNESARDKWSENQAGHLVDPNGNPTGPQLPAAPNGMSPRSPLIGPQGRGMVAPPSIDQAPSAAPIPSIGDTPSVSPNEAIGGYTLPGAGVQNPFKGSGGAYDYSKPLGYAEGTSSVGPALMGASMPNLQQSAPQTSGPASGALLSSPTPQGLSAPSTPYATSYDGRLIQRNSSGAVPAGPPPGAPGPSGVATNYNGVSDAKHPGVSREEMEGNYRAMGMPADQARAAAAGAPSRREQSYAGYRSLGHSDADAQYFTALEYGLPGRKPIPNAGMPRYSEETPPLDPYNDLHGFAGERRGKYDRYSNGTSDIHAPGDGTVDTTNAKLANGEAVLNKGAAEHLGRPIIQALNAVGAARMGMVPGNSTQDDRVKPSEAAQTAGKTGAQGYAKGTSKASPKGKSAPTSKDDAKPSPKSAGGSSASDTPALNQIDPKLLAAALQMGSMGQPQAAQQTTMPPAGGPGMGMM